MVSRNANIDVRVFFAAVPGKSQVSDNVSAQALEIKIRFHAVNKADAQCFRGLTIERSIAKCVSFFLPILAALVLVPRANAQSLTMDGESGIFLQPLADVVPSPQHKFGGPTVSFHAVDAGPVAGNYINIGVEEGFGNWLEFGYTRSNHTDGGDPTISPLFNFSGMNIFNFKAKVLPANYHGHKYLPTISVGGVLRTNDASTLASAPTCLRRSPPGRKTGCRCNLY